MNKYAVTFERFLSEDQEFAAEHFPDAPLTVQLVCQLRLEIQGNQNFRASVVMPREARMCRENKDRYFIDAEIDSTLNRADFCAELQRCYDEFGVAGFFKIAKP